MLRTVPIDGASLAISESLLSDARAFRQGARNLQDGLSLINNITEGGLTVIADIEDFDIKRTCLIVIHRRLT